MFSCRNIFKSLSIQQFSIFSETNKTKPEELSTNKAALRQELNLCRKEIKKSKRWNIMPSPKCFERAAMLYRQTKNYENE